MRKWRVGTISMGLLLVASGLGLLAAQVNSTAVAQAALKWWPIIFIVLGMEVLAYTYLRKEQSERVIYDILSIIMIIVLIISGLGIKMFQEAGLAQRVVKEIDSDNYNISMAREVGIDQQVKKLVLSGRNCSNLEIRSSETNVIIVSGDASIRALSRDEAQRQAEQNFQVVSRQVGDSLYVDLDGISWHGHILIPGHLQVEVYAPDSAVTVLAEQVNNSWLIRGHGNIDLTLPQGSDVLLTVMGEEPVRLKGNLQWAVARQSTSKAGTNTSPGGQRVEVKVDNRNPDEVSMVLKDESNDYEAQARLGNATHRFTVISEGGEVNARQLP